MDAEGEGFADAKSCSRSERNDECVAAEDAGDFCDGGALVFVGIAVVVGASSLMCVDVFRREAEAVDDVAVSGVESPLDWALWGALEAGEVVHGAGGGEDAGIAVLGGVVAAQKEVVDVGEGGDVASLDFFCEVVGTGAGDGDGVGERFGGGASPCVCVAEDATDDCSDLLLSVAAEVADVDGGELGGGDGVDGNVPEGFAVFRGDVGVGGGCAAAPSVLVGVHP